MPARPREGYRTNVLLLRRYPGIRFAGMIRRTIVLATVGAPVAGCGDGSGPSPAPRNVSDGLLRDRAAALLDGKRHHRDQQLGAARRRRDLSRFSVGCGLHCNRKNRGSVNPTICRSALVVTHRDNGDERRKRADDDSGDAPLGLGIALAGHLETITGLDTELVERGAARDCRLEFVAIPQ